MIRDRIKPPFRADHVGSLKRPQALQLRRELLLGAHTPNANLGRHQNEELKALEDEAILEAIRLQENCGLLSVTDGEFRRRSWWTDFMLGFDGIEQSEKRSKLEFRDAQGQVRSNSSIELTGRIGWKGDIFSDQFRFVAENTKVTPKLTIPAPTNLLYFLGGEIDRVPDYRDRALFWTDLAQAYAKEVEALYASGCRYLQIDDITLAFLCDAERRAEVASWGHNPDELLSDYIRAINIAVGSRPADLVVTMHICRGNFSGAFGAQGGYEAIAERLFNEAAIDGFFLEYDSPRAGSFEPLRHLPASKLVVLGLISTKTPVLENPDEVCRRIDDASRFADLDQLCISPQCGFASNYLGNPVTIDDERRKLNLVVSIADSVWGSETAKIRSAQ
ncbi:5-methyltetrahydropteroyltriglutamate--homocysteine S-methyltransferase [Roseiarcaceae bacterium H3SJ34-1]|uniref:5-methyltetrahydropteroyltriglutamate-- homocysteine S-methyltransferase n=1 Tax=Terripilifer ovatus TaxID=3032367 RepID=UPI003AB97643|nr:5-methyltetrahydropteroyltriglutamate--homocysteine S-methyltransferase [Roseiarcaceae bacterium H3SJ34-1]